MNYLFKNGGLASKLRRAAKIKAPLRVQFLLTFGGRGARAGTLLSKGRGRCPWESAKLSVFLILMARLRCCQMSPISQSTFQSQKIPCVNHSAFDAVFLEWPHTHTFTDIHIFHYFCLYQQYFKYSIDIGPQWMWKQFPNKLSQHPRATAITFEFGRHIDIYTKVAQHPKITNPFLVKLKK